MLKATINTANAISFSTIEGAVPIVIAAINAKHINIVFMHYLCTRGSIKTYQIYYMFGELKSLGLKVSDIVTKAIGTWTFVILYSLAMLIWMFLHMNGILQIDGPDFIKWNLFLSYFAGIQASIVLMSTTRQAERDRIKHEEQLEELADKITEYSRYAELTSDLIEDYLKETNDPEKTSES